MGADLYTVRLRILKLLIPALLPSWRFFDFIAPSPRIQFSLLSADNDMAREWHEFRPRPAYVSLRQMLGRMFWNPVWNESLFLVSCAERLIEHPTTHSEEEIFKRIEHELKRNVLRGTGNSATHLQFRLLLVQRQGTTLQEDVVFHSRIRPLSMRDAG